MKIVKMQWKILNYNKNELYINQSMQHIANPLFTSVLIKSLYVQIYSPYSTHPNCLATLYTPEYNSILVHKWYPEIQAPLASSLVQDTHPKWSDAYSINY